ncbi:polyprenol reductase isoform X2 [Chiloscyllium plagiosum]|uniref:polyprenol reductase isoform X2 n=1 Tax=Chiloscyllium plagiosum TaxID=36176 RepID=UPI001CB7D8CA|nr:polyprenol reductase isoform X2 [Chiloscyllium plagiosum]
MLSVSELSVIGVVWLVFAAIFLFCVIFHNVWSGLGIFALLFQDFMRYGKSKQYFFQRPAWLQRLDLPKRWFTHFYMVSVIWNAVLLGITCRSLFLRYPYPMWLQRVLNLLCGNVLHLTSGDELSILLVQIMLCVQAVRRLTECLFISVFSSGVIHPVQYCWGLVYYVLVGLTVHCEGPVLGTKGEVIHFKHSIPYGDWFEVVSCPHYLAELLIYLAISVTFEGRHLTWWFVILYVFFSHAMMAILCHEFYVKKFNNYPKIRKAFIPFIF